MPDFWASKGSSVDRRSNWIEITWHIADYSQDLTSAFPSWDVGNLSKTWYGWSNINMISLAKQNHKHYKNKINLNRIACNSDIRVLVQLNKGIFFNNPVMSTSLWWSAAIESTINMVKIISLIIKSSPLIILDEKRKK